VSDDPPVREERLRCAECGREAEDDTRGWRGLHGREYPEDQPETLVFCPECWEREFRES
jgi:DNA-directed RNA polymerase subunit RPC12/RpoP